jgi:hypothetical protein
MNYKYTIESPYGALTLEFSECGTSGGYYLRNLVGKVVCSSHTKTIGPRSLPFSYITEMELWFDSVTQMITPALPIISQMPQSQEQVLRFCVWGGRYAFDLLESCPSIAFCLAGQVLRETSTNDLGNTINSLTRKRRAELLAYFEFHSAKWVVKIFNKVPGSECSHMLFRLLFNIIEREIRLQAEITGMELDSYRSQLLSMIVKRPKIKTLRHIPRINRFVLEMINNDSLDSLVHNSFYIEACLLDNNQTSSTMSVVREIERLVSTDDNVYEIVKKNGLRSVGDLQHCHQEIIDYINADKSLYYCRKLRFPDPPIPDQIWKVKNERYGIRAIRNGEELLNEGRIMNHCIASYGERICSSRGELFVYHVDFPGKHPATALIAMNTDGSFTLRELRGKSNIDVPLDVRKRVEKWLTIRNTDLIMKSKD